MNISTTLKSRPVSWAISFLMHCPGLGVLAYVALEVTEVTCVKKVTKPMKLGNKDNRGVTWVTTIKEAT